jgi:hypothetical protein
VHGESPLGAIRPRHCPCIALRMRPCSEDATQVSLFSRSGQVQLGFYIDLAAKLARVLTAASSDSSHGATICAMWFACR